MSNKINKYEITKEELYLIDENGNKVKVNSLDIENINQIYLEGEKILGGEESPHYLRAGIKKIMDECGDRGVIPTNYLIRKADEHYYFIIKKDTIKNGQLEEIEVPSIVGKNIDGKKTKVKVEDKDNLTKVSRYKFEYGELSVTIDFKNHEKFAIHKVIVNEKKSLDYTNIQSEDWCLIKTSTVGRDDCCTCIMDICKLYLDKNPKSKFVIEGREYNKSSNNNRGDKNMYDEYENILTKVKNLIDNKMYQIILTGAPGTGKTYTAKEIAKSYSNKSTKKTFEEKDKDGKIFEEKDKDGKIKWVNYKLVQFHPSYDYTDFVEGIRPIENENGKMIFKKFDGIFKEFCRKVAVENKNNEESRAQKYFFIIDEINRADLSKVLGELMLGLEKDKRGEPIITQYSNIKETHGVDKNDDVFKNGFFIPENIVIIGTMNDIDRSVESMDFALRRRFTWLEVDVDLEGKLLTDAFNKSKDKFCPEIKDDVKRKEIINRICALNRVISDKDNSEGDKLGLNKHYYVSQGYFTGIPNGGEIDNIDSLLRWIWDYRLKSLLEEYVRGEASNKFMVDCKKAFLKTLEEENSNKNDDDQPKVSK